MAKNKSINSMEVVALSAYTSPAIVIDKTNEWVKYGVDNDYFNELKSYYDGSTTSSSLINGITARIFGGGLRAKDASKKPNEWASLKSIIKDKDLKKAIMDRKMLGMAAFKVSYDKGAVKSIKHWPMDTIRAGKANDKGEITKYFWSNDWKSVKKGDTPESFPAFGTSNSKQEEIYIIKPYVTGEFYYSQPDYAASLPYAKLEAEIGDYLINEVINGFSGSLMINMPGVPASDEDERLVVRKMTRKFTGSTGDKILFNFIDNADDKATVDRLSLDDAPSHYEFLSKECVDKLISGHRITSPLLVGLRDSGSGFSSTADEMETSEVLLDKVVIDGFKNEIVDAIDEIVSVNKISLKLYFASIQPFDESELEAVGVDEEEEEEDKSKRSELSEKLTKHILSLLPQNKEQDNNTKNI